MKEYPSVFTTLFFCWLGHLERNNHLKPVAAGGSQWEAIRPGVYLPKTPGTWIPKRHQGIINSEMQTQIG